MSVPARSPLVHHELCFGCGRQNLFGLLVEIEEAGVGSVKGRCFFKQDHQGPEPGFAHPGLLSAALSEAISLARGGRGRIVGLEVRFEGAAPVGTFVELEASADSATASAAGRRVASARGSWG